jgi:hypothetical protein
VAKVGKSKAGVTISQQAVVHPWLAADAHGNKQTNKPISNLAADTNSCERKSHSIILSIVVYSEQSTLKLDQIRI